MPTLDFKGKQHIYAHHLTVPYRPLVPDESRSLNPGSTDDNLIIKGDNLYALKALLPRYAGRIKCVYIDPPYNTGNGDWVYNDSVSSPLMNAWFENQSPVDGEDLERHDKWLCMMWPRLNLLKELISEDGFILVSIDDNEQHHLRLLLDEIFGKDNFRNEISVRRYDKNISTQFASNGLKSLAVGFERVLLYSKSISSTLNPAYREATEERKNSGYWKGFHNSADRPTMRYELLGVVPQEGQWKWQHEVAERAVRNYEDYLATGPLVSLEEYWAETGKSKNFIRRRENLTKGKNKGVEHWIPPSDVVLLSSNWTDLLASESILHTYGVRFDAPKRTEFVMRLLSLTACEDALVLDSFAGSGTTAHAVLSLNKKDDGNRKFILVECEDYADSITAERVRRVINGVPKSSDKLVQQGLGGSFTYYTLGESIDIESLLTGDALPTFSSLAVYLLYTASGTSASHENFESQNEDGLFYSNNHTNFYLLYKPDLVYLRSNSAVLTGDRAKRISQANQKDGKNAVVFGAGKYIGQRELSKMDITFSQLPFEIFRAE